jgi:myo-inositol catabolism protein IolC
VRHLFVLAFDHRNSFRTDFFGIDGTLTAQDQARAREAKLVIYAGLLRAVAQGLPSGCPAVLVDEEYGGDVARLAREAGITVALAVERSGQTELAFEADPFYDPIVRLQPDCVKVLVRYNPGADVAMNRRQRRRILQLQEWLQDRNTDLMLELLVPAQSAQMDSVGGDLERFHRESRPGLTVTAIHELVQGGLAPRFWKLEGMESAADYAAVAAAVRSGARSDATCLVLGRGADVVAVKRWLSLAAPIAGFGGFAVGRTIWWDPLRAHVFDGADREVTVAKIAANYLGLVDLYLEASGSPVASI